MCDEVDENAWRSRVANLQLWPYLSELQIDAPCDWLLMSILFVQRAMVRVICTKLSCSPSSRLHLPLRAMPLQFIR